MFRSVTDKCLNKWTSWWLIAAVLMLAGCGGHIYHKVEPGETLYSIGWRYGHDYKTIAKWNGIAAPYVISKGQVIRVAPPGPDGEKSTHVTKSKQPTANKVGKLTDKRESRSSKPYAKVKGWQWPTKGKVVRRFSAKSSVRKGIDIAGKDGQEIYAVSSGKVVYSGSGLVGYGRLIIIKHNRTFLSAYGHNRRLMVKEGDRVKSGQVIAEMGSSGTAANSPMLHFEIRRDGKPVNPMRYLPAR